LEADNTVIRSSCPLCSAELKFRNASFAEKPFRCPDCQGRLRLVQGLENFFNVVVDNQITELEPSQINSQRDTNRTEFAGKKAGFKKSAKLHQFWHRLKSPAGIAWSVALAGFVILLFLTRPSPKQTLSEAKDANNVESTEVSRNEKTKEFSHENKPLVAPKPVRKFPRIAVEPLPNKKPMKKLVLNTENAAPIPPLVAVRPRRKVIFFPVPQYNPEDFEKAFAQKIKHFEQPKPVAARLLFEELAEMSGIPIRFMPTELANSGGLLDRKLKLKLIDTNVGEIFSAILNEQNLEMRTDEKGILIVMKKTK